MNIREDDSDRKCDLYLEKESEGKVFTIYIEEMINLRSI